MLIIKSLEKGVKQAFRNYNFSCTTFRVFNIILGAHGTTVEIVLN